MTDTVLDHDFDDDLTLGCAPRPDAAAMARILRVPVLDVVVPVYNEQVALAGSVRRLRRYLDEHFPYSARITIADNASVDETPQDRCRAGRDAARRPRRAVGAEGPRTRAQRGVVDVGCSGVGLHGRRPVHRPRRVGTLGGATDLRPLRRGDRHPTRQGVAGRARPQAGVHLALLQPDPQIHSRGALLRCPVWIQGHPQ